MSVVKKRSNFMETDEGLEAERMLRQMMIDATFNTGGSFSANTLLYPDKEMPFMDKHLNYLSMHPEINPQQYLANLRLKTRIR